MKNKDHIMCFTYGGKGYYHTKCPRRGGSKGREAMGMPVIRKDEEHIMCFSCNKKKHYHNQY